MYPNPFDRKHSTIRQLSGHDARRRRCGAHSEIPSYRSREAGCDFVLKTLPSCQLRYDPPCSVRDVETAVLPKKEEKMMEFPSSRRNSMRRKSSK
ncbi:hypothetical protein GE061_013559 [Apolygus lucorum]|uniref:Uncharacterized protein n=1 Tax=Apolygus lucorum TaxID=248454 RepID=A0A8S9XNC3_APOLU|nr:hypothetical protein GE061_013559 [Apolygus lucorum]